MVVGPNGVDILAKSDDFTASPAEFKVMLDNIVNQTCYQANGVVLGGFRYSTVTASQYIMWSKIEMSTTESWSVTGLETNGS